MLAIACVTTFVLCEPYRREQRFMQVLEEAGGSFATKNCPPEWAVNMLGNDRLPLFDQLSIVDLQRTSATDLALSRLRGLKNVEYLQLGRSSVTNAGMAHLRNFGGLRLLSLRETGITDAGLVHLQGVTRLEYLYLSRTVVTDAGLLHLSGLSNLKLLSLYDTPTTARGIEALRKALPNCNVVTSDEFR